MFLAGYEATGTAPCALRKYWRSLDEALGGMHALRRRVLLKSTEALIAVRRLTLMDVARSRPGAERVRAPLKALIACLANRHLHVERERIYGAAWRAGWCAARGR